MLLSATREISVLNDLLEGVVTSGHGYRQAAEAGADTGLRPLFERRVAERRKLATEMRVELRRLGGTPVSDDAGAAQGRRLVHMEAMEGRLRRKFERVLGAGGLSVPVFILLARAYVAISSGHDQIRHMRLPCEAVK